MIIKNALVRSEGKFKRQDISIDDDGRIGMVADHIGGDDSFDAAGDLVIRGIRNCHMHASTVLIRGAPTRGGLDGWVEDVLWRFEEGLTRKEVYYGSLYSACQMLKSGITYFEDMHFMESEVLRACEDSGIKASLSEALMDQNDWESSPSNIASTIELAKLARKSALVEAKMGIVSVRMASEELIDDIVRTYSDNPGLFSGYHLHMNEVRQDSSFSQRSYGMPTAHFFDSKGILGRNTTLAHCVHVSDDEIKLMAERGVCAALCPASNIRLDSGVAPLERLINGGVDISLGIDSPAINDGFDLFSDARLIGLLNGVGPERLIEVLFGKRPLSEGDDADLIFLDRRNFLSPSALSKHICFSMGPSSVRHVMVMGRFVVSDGEISSLDEEKARDKAVKMSEQAISRLERFQ
ncbi:MAG: amidohydrolase family protein [Candidatus Methanofastidiosa archaeon]|nr:amidohydrolase family protein [Candidatus Methanofastidiosa archaeon]